MEDFILHVTEDHCERLGEVFDTVAASDAIKAMTDSISLDLEATFFPWLR